MPWVKVDEHFYDHPKWADAPGDSIALWLAAMAWCNRNDSADGYIPAAKTQGLVNVRNLRRTLADLCQREAFHPERAGYLIHDYPEYQQTDRVKKIAEKRSAAGKKGAAVKWGEHRRRQELADDPGHTDDQAPPMANDMANEMASAMAKRAIGEWPDTDSESTLTSRSLTTPTVVGRPNGVEDEMNSWAERRRMP